MVKGVSRRVIVLKMNEEKFFEEAIFVVRSDALIDSSVSQESILKEAKRVAEDYARNNLEGGKKKFRIPAPAFAAAGAGVTALLWVVLRIFGI